ncbi:MAG: FG-GAP repeat protein [Planctomycetales bacterium]|nr:FG-GAP repeat protein [Planctomycetales bacterium]
MEERQRLLRPIRATDMTQLVQLDLSRLESTGPLTGIEYATNLELLSLAGAATEDLTLALFEPGFHRGRERQGRLGLGNLKLLDLDFVDLVGGNIGDRQTYPGNESPFSALDLMPTLSNLEFLSVDRLSSVGQTSLDTLPVGTNQLDQLHWLSAVGIGLSSVQGVLADDGDSLDQLRYLYLNENNVVDIGPLVNLDALQWLELRAKKVSSIDALLGQYIIDNFEPGYVEHGSYDVGNGPVSVWSGDVNAGAFERDYRLAPAQVDDARVEFTFSDLPNGTYDVLATWTAHASRTRDAQYEITSGDSNEIAVVDQRYNPDGVVFGDRPWQVIGEVTVTDGTVTVSLTGSPDGNLTADAVRLSQPVLPKLEILNLLDNPLDNAAHEYVLPGLQSDRDLLDRMSSGFEPLESINLQRTNVATPFINAAIKETAMTEDGSVIIDPSLVFADTFGGTYSDHVVESFVTDEGRLIVVGIVQGNAGELIRFDENHTYRLAGATDVFALGYSEYGEIEFATLIGSTASDDVAQVSLSDDGELFVAVETLSFGVDVLESSDGISVPVYAGQNVVTVKIDGSGNIAWAKGVHGTFARARQILPLSDGGVAVTGEFVGNPGDSVDFGSGQGGAFAGSVDGFVVRYASNGETAWATVIGGDGAESVTNAVAYSDSSVLVLGSYASDQLLPGVLAAPNASDAFVLRFNADGSLAWHDEFGGSGEDRAEYLFVDDSDGASTVISQVGTSLDIRRYAPDGNALWSQTITSPGVAFSVAKTELDISGGLVVAGTVIGSAGANVTIGGDSYSLAGADDNFVTRIRPDGEVGWGVVFGGNSTDQITDLAFVSDGFVVSGVLNGPQGTFVSLGGTNLSLLGTGDAFAASFSLTGQVRWSHAFGTGQYDIVENIVVGSQGDVFLAGRVDGPTGSTAQFGTETVTLAGSDDLFVARLDSGGSIAWANAVGGVGIDRAPTILLTERDDLLLVGSVGSIGFVSNLITVGEKTFAFPGDFQGGKRGIASVLYNREGQLVWAEVARSSGSADPSDVFMNARGTIQIVGEFDRSGPDPMLVSTETLEVVGDRDVIVTAFRPTPFTDFDVTVDSPDVSASIEPFGVIRLDSDNGFRGEANVSYRVTDNGRVAEHRFDIHVGTGAVYGTKYEDLNDNGVRDSDDPSSPLFEPPVEGWPIFVDQNGNEVWDAGEPITVTDSNGEYKFAGLMLGQDVDVVEFASTAWVPTQNERYARLLDALFGADGEASDLHVVGDHLIFTAATGSGDRTLWQYDGVQLSIVSGGDLPDGGINPQEITPAGDVLYFSISTPQRGRELYRYRPSSGEPKLIPEGKPGPDDSEPLNIILSGDDVFYTSLVSTGMQINGSELNDGFGISVESAGDVNGDGVADMVVGAFLADGSRGHAYVVFGSEKLSESFDISSIDGTNGFRITGQSAGDRLGIRVAPAGDVNNDNIDDLIVGAYRANGIGEAAIIFGSASGFPASLDIGSLDGSNGFRFVGISSDIELGRGVASAGDINNDNIADVVIGAYRADAQGRIDSGEAYVVFGHSGLFSATMNVNDLDGSNGFAISGAANDERLGLSVAELGDVNGDSIDDFLVGAHGATGKAYLLYGTASGFPARLDLAMLTPDAGITLLGGNGDTTGWDIASAGDFNGDGVQDILIGAPFADHTGNDNAGACYLVFGRADGFTGDVDLSLLDGSNGVKLQSQGFDNRLGVSVAGLGDLNNDGFDDIGLVSVGSEPTRWIVFGRSGGLPSLVSLAVTSDLDVTRLTGPIRYGEPGSIAGAGDVNDDGIPDMIVAAALDSAGQVFVLFGGTGFAESAALSDVAAPKRELFVYDAQTELRKPITTTLQNLPSGSDPDSIVVDGNSIYFTAAAPDLGRGMYRYDMDTETLERISPAGAVEPGMITPTDAGIAFVADVPRGFQFEGINTNDLIGSDARSVGDVNGDGFDDLIIGARWHDSQGLIGAGETYVIFGGPGARPQTINPASLDGRNGFRIGGKAAGDALGIAVSSAGDINHDGIGDLLIGAIGAQPSGRSNAGESYVIFGRRDGFDASFDLNALDGTNGFTMIGAANSSSGATVASIGDLNNDNIDDIAIGAYAADSNAGRAHIIFGRDTTFPAIIDLAAMDGTDGFSLLGKSSLNYLGRSLSGAGDVNGDGISDLLVGAYYASPQGIPRTGEAYVLFGRNTGFAAEINANALDGNLGFAIRGINPSEYTGYRVDSLGDINGDDVDDIIVSAVRADSSLGQINAGASYVLFGKAAAFPAAIDVDELDGTNGFTLRGHNASDLTGVSVAGAGDLNADGLADLAIGGYRVDSDGLANAGVTYVLFGNSSRFAANIELNTIQNYGGVKIAGAAGGDESGDPIASAGDFNADGYDDLLISAFQADVGTENDAGRVYIVYGRPNFSPTASLSQLTAPNHELFVYDAATQQTNNVTSRLPNTLANASPSDVIVDGNVLYFRASEADIGPGMYRYDTNTDNLRRISSPGSFEVVEQLPIDDGIAFVSKVPGGAILRGVDANDQTGIWVSDAGDFNGDGYEDVVIGARYADDAGAAYLLYGSESGIDYDFDLNSLTAAGGGDGSRGLVLYGIDASDRFGAIIGSGNFNGDDYDDLVITSAFAAESGGSQVGEIYVVFGSADGYGAEIRMTDLTAPQGFTVYGVANSFRTGNTVAVGDVDDDGLDDLLIAAYLANPNGVANAGSVYVVYGSTTPPANRLDLSDLSGPVNASGSLGMVINGINFNDQLSAVAIAGDVNNDGVNDLLMASRLVDRSPTEADVGQIYVVYGSRTRNRSQLNLVDLTTNGGGNGTLGFVINGIDAGDIAGTDTAGIGDFNGDGIDDFLVGARQADPNGDLSGESYLIFGSDTPFPAEWSAFELTVAGGGDGTRGLVFSGVGAGDLSGLNVSAVGDFNADGLDDLAISGLDPDNAGRVYVVYGSSALVDAEIELSTFASLGESGGLRGTVFQGVGDGDSLGSSVASAGDFNGDGHSDLVIGAYAATRDSKALVGEAYLIYGRPNAASFANVAQLLEPQYELFVFSELADLTLNVTVQLPNLLESAAPESLITSGEFLYFTAIESESLRSWYRFDLTNHILDPLPSVTMDGDPFTDPQDPVAIGDSLYFAAFDSNLRTNLYRLRLDTTDITNVTGRNSLAATDYFPSSLRELDGTLYYSASAISTGREYWSYDPVTDSIELLANLNPGAANSDPDSLTPFGDKLALFATTDYSGRELRVIGESKTLRVADLAQSPIQTVADFGNFKVVDALANSNDAGVFYVEGDSSTLSGHVRGLAGPITATWTVVDSQSNEVFRQVLASIVPVVDGFGIWSATVDALLPSIDDGRYVARLEVTDAASGDSYADQYELIVRAQAPQFELGDPVTLDQGDVFTLPVTFTDPGLDNWEALVDYGTGDGPQPVVVDPLTRSLLLNHAYLLFGDYTVSLTIRDLDDNLEHTQTLGVHVNAVAPVIDVRRTSGQVNESIEEGDTFARQIRFVGSSATWTVTVDYGDGSAPVEVGYSGNQITAEWFADLRHRYINEGVYTVLVTVDNENDAYLPVTASFEVTASNVSPVIDMDLTVVDPALINEGGVATLRVIYSDKGWDDAQSIMIDWGDGQTTPVVGDLHNGQGTSILSHVYRDNGSYLIGISISDDSGATTSIDPGLDVTVNNVEPEIAELRIDRTVINEGDLFTLSGVLLDPGTADPISVSINWNDGNQSSATVSFVDGIADFFASHTYAQDGQYTATITIDDGTGPDVLQDVNLTVFNSAPLVSVSGPLNVSEGDSVTVSGFYTDAGIQDVLTYRWEVFTNNSDSVASSSGTINQGEPVPDFNFTVANQGRYIVRLVIIDDHDQSTNQLAIDVANNAPTSGGTVVETQLTAGDPFLLSGQFTDSGVADQWSATVDFGDGVIVPLLIGSPPAGAASAMPAQGPLNLTIIDDNSSDQPDSAPTSGAAAVYNGEFFGYHAFASPGTYTVTVRVRDRDGGTTTQQIQIQVDPNPNPSPLLQVENFATTPSGFTIQFNRAADLSAFNLYGSSLGTSQVPVSDLAVYANGSGGLVSGSTVYHAASNSLEFIRTGGTLPDDTYTVTLKSGIHSVISDVGGLLDGNHDGSAGDDYQQSFTVANGSKRVLSLGDFSRAQSQTIDLTPSTLDDLSYPIRITQADQVTSIDFTLEYDPASMVVQRVDRPANVPEDWTLSIDLTTPGRAVLNASGVTPLSGVDVPVFDLIATVASTATYGETHLMRITSVQLNGGTIDAIGDAAVHYVIPVGDTSGDGSYSGFDAALLSRVLKNDDSGFSAHRHIDPRIVATLATDRPLNPNDAATIAGKVVGDGSATIPDIPSGIPVSERSSDVTITVEDATAPSGGRVEVPIRLTGSSNEILSFDLQIDYDSSKLSLSPEDVLVSAATTGWSHQATVDQLTGTLRLSFYSATPITAPDFELVRLAFTAFGGTGDASISVNTQAIDPRGVHRSRINEQYLPDVGSAGIVTVVSGLPPTIEQVVMNDGSNSRSHITSLTVMFDSRVDHAMLGSAFEITNLDLSVPVGSINVSASDQDGKTIAVLTFDGSSTVSRNGVGPLTSSLADGNYRLRVIASQIKSASGLLMTEDYLMGEQPSDLFFRLFGDSDGDRDVDGQDFGRFGLSFLRSVSDPDYDPSFDSDGDGDVDGQDYGRFSSNFLKHI